MRKITIRVDGTGGGTYCAVAHVEGGGSEEGRSGNALAALGKLFLRLADAGHLEGITIEPSAVTGEVNPFAD